MAAQIDMFSNEPDDIPAAPDHDPSAVINEAEIVQHLIETGRYRVVTKLKHRRPQFGLKGVIIDTETTGLNYRKDEIIEMGAAAFTFDEYGTIGDVTDIHGGLR